MNENRPVLSATVM